MAKLTRWLDGEPTLRAGWLLLPCVLMAALASVAAAAGTPVAQGDILSVTVEEEASLNGEVKVNLDGQIVLARVGGLEVAGLDLEGVRALIEAALKEKDIIRTPTVRVEVATYRPFYVGGQVVTPGSIPFEPGLTVRHALLLAGGLGRADAASMTLAGLAELRGQWRASSYELFQVRSEIARLNGEMERTKDVEFPASGTSLPAADAESIRDLDANLLGDRVAEWEGEQAHLRDALALFDLEIDILVQQTELQANERDVQETELENTRSLVERGVVPRPRLQELEREKSALMRDMLESQAFAARARQAKATAEHDLASADVDWRLEVRSKLRDALREQMRLEAELDTLSASLVAAGLDITEDPAATPEPHVTIYRSVEGAEQAVPAEMNTEIRPGDILEVAVVRAPAG